METNKTQKLYLPHELILQILLRLPVKSLIRFKCVCKSWFSLISDPHFANTHFEITTATHSRRVMFILEEDPETRSVDFEASLYDDSSFSVSHNLNFLLPKTYRDLEIKGSCRGIIVMRYRSEFHLWNPSTGVNKQIILSPNDHERNFFGFGYDKSTNDYLVISMSNYFCSDESFLDFFSMRANTWEQIETTHSCYTYLDRDDNTSAGVGLLFNGAIHWLACRYDHDLKDDNSIVAFDLTERKLVDMQLPHDCNPDLYRCGLWVFGEFLSLWSTDYRKNNTVEIWVMNEYKLHSSWTKTIVLPIVEFLYENLAPLCSTKSGDIVTADCCGACGAGLAKYDGKGQLLEYCNHRNPYRMDLYQVTLYTESLLTMGTNKTQKLYLPHELILQILLRLPVKSLVRFKCVCKSWFSLISDPHFANSHFEITTATHSHRVMFILEEDPETRSVDFEAPLYDDSSISVSHNLNFVLPETYRDLEIKGSCRGIIVMRCRSEFHLWNPSTGVNKQIILSPNDHERNFFGFGYDKSTNDYLVISMSNYFCSEESFLDFFSMRANTWEQIENTHLCYTYLGEADGTYAGVGLLFNGAIHWLACR